MKKKFNQSIKAIKKIEKDCTLHGHDLDKRVLIKKSTTTKKEKESFILIL